MKILFILPEFEPDTSGGICAYYKNLLSELILDEHYEIIIIQGSAYDANGGKSEWNGIDIHYLDYNSLQEKKQHFNHLNIFPEFQNHIASAWAIFDLAYTLNIKFDLVITTDWGLGFVPWIVKSEIPTIVHLHGSIGQIDFYEPRQGLEFWSNQYLQIESDLFNYASCLITHSKQNIKFWSDRLVNEDCIKLIPPAFNSNVKILNASDKINQEQPYIGLVLGRIQYWKGPIELCEAVKLLPVTDQQRLKIYWAGRDTIYSEMNMSMNSYLLKTYPNIWDKIIIPISNQTKEEIENLYPKIDFAIVPSNWDMFNMSAVEHLLNHKPIICSNAAGASDFLFNTNSVLISSDIQSLSLAILKRLKTSKTELKKLGQLGSDYVKNLFNEKLITEAHKESFTNATNSFKANTLLINKYRWLLPNKKLKNNSKVVLLNNWGLKEIIKTATNRLLKRLFKRINA